MTLFLIYILRWAITITMLYSLFGLFLRKETFHTFNRMVLLGILFASMILPVCQVETSHTTPISTSIQTIEQYIDNAADSELAFDDSSDEYTPPTTMSDNNPPTLAICIIVIYLLGLTWAWGRLLVSVIGLSIMRRNGKRVHYDGLPDGVRVIIIDKAKMPFSWMKCIVMNSEDYANNRDIIIRHELGHIHYHHSWDMLLCEWTACMLWWVPFVWMLRRDLRDIHEYQADRVVLKSGVDEEAYHRLLIKKSTELYPMPIVNSLAASSIKRRFNMMFRKKSNRLAMLKVLYVLPLSAFVIISFAKPHIVNEVEQALYIEEEKILDAIAPILDESEYIANEPTIEQPQPEVHAEAKIETHADTTSAQPAAEHVYQGAVSNERPTTAEDGTAILYDLPLNTYSKYSYGGYYIRRLTDETHFVYIGTCESDDELVWLAGDHTYLIDTKTGDYYKARGSLTPRTWNREFRIRGMKNKTYALTIVFPPLPDSVEDVAIIEVADISRGSIKSIKQMEVQ